MPMNTHRRITSNFLSLIFSEFFSKILQLLVFIYLARALGTERFGIFSFGLAFGLLAAIITDFGMGYLLVREVSRSRKDAEKYLSNAVITKIFLSIATLAASYAFLNLMNYSPQQKLVAYIMLAFAILQTFTDIYSSVFRAFEKMQYDASMKILRMAILSGLVFYLLKKGISATSAPILFLAAEIFVLVAAMMLVYSKFIKPSLAFDFKFSKHLLRESSFFCLSVAFAGLFLYIDLIMLSKLGSSSDVGIYAAASNIALALLAIPMMYGNAIYPLISRLYINSKDGLKFAYERSFRYMALAGVAVSAGLYAVSEKVIIVFYGKEYIASAVILSIIAWHLCLRFANVISGFTLSSMDKQRSRVLSQGAVALSKVAFNFILIPPYGILGAAVATVLSEIIFFAVYNFLISRYGIKTSFIMPFFKPIIAASIMIASLYFIENLFIAITAGILIYTAALSVMGAIDSEDKNIINKLIRNI